MADKALGTAPSNAADVATKGYIDTSLAAKFSGTATAFVATQESTSSTSYTDLATTTDQVTVTVGSSGMVLITVQAQMSNSGLNYCYISPALSGANTVAATDNYCTFFVNPSAGWTGQYGNTIVLTGLSPGSTTFKMKYKTNAGTGFFANRRIAVIPL